jgi:hypothetical protein
MRTARIEEPGVPMAHTSSMRRMLSALLALVAIGLASASAASAMSDQTAAPKTASAAQKPATRAGRQAVAAKPSAPTQAAPEQTAPLLPLWPANDPAAQAGVVWNSQGLRIEAANSSLQQILKEVSTVTGAKVSGLGGDQRIFGIYGPGPAREVLSELLDGSGYNVVMIGDQGQGTPRQILLSRKPNGPAPPSTGNNSSQGGDEGGSADAEEPPPQPEQPQPVAQPQNGSQNGPPGFTPGAQPRTPQQILQEMQQRQQQIQQQQQQQQQQR